MRSQGVNRCLTALGWLRQGNLIELFPGTLACPGSELPSKLSQFFYFMSPLVITGLLWFSAVGCGLLGGLYFAFSAFIMSALARIEPAHGVVAMNSINVTIVRTLFLPFFLGTTLTSLALVVIGLVQWEQAGSTAMIVGGAVYFLGMFVVTMVFNVPLNNQLAVVTPGTADAGFVWARYLKEWTLWNHVRTLASTGASAAFIAALVAR